MAEQASEHTTIAARPALCWDVATDFEAYPEWAKDIKEAEVVHRDTDGRASVVRFRAAAMGRSTTYLLGYDYRDAPRVLAWRLLEGDITKQLDGSYTFTVADDGETTDVDYELVAELTLPLPGFVKRRGESKIMQTALRDFKARVEAVAASS
jgi:ribosome-associated toxin RatA of RatAB toxin-antitoxin module